eukprot:GFUD01016979.1.p1 GENE.GFUD01016979.1~~GFUD01016979.1.p1  ORF type:complete len:641 (+),score=196.19 GFUD01016979.1:63-1985(+)
MCWLPVALLFLSSVSPSLGFDSPWTFTCAQARGLCVKRLPEENEAQTSQSVCSLTCPPSSVLWPLPTNYSLGSTVTPFNPALVTVESNAMSSRVEGAVWRMRDLLTMKGEEGPLDSQVSLTINVDIISSAQAVPAVGVDESYALSVSKTEDVVVNIKAETFFGARHAIETLFQLTEWDSFTHAYVIQDSVQIEDEPFYPHRGISLDTSRNFIPVSKIKELIDSLSYSKMNVFHWHITDTQSFPLILDSLPDFVKFGAYSPDMVYTRADVADLVSYASDRGVMIIPELDAPAHVGAGWEAVEDTFTVCRDAEPWQSWCVQPPCGQLNPASQGMYDVLEMIHKEFLEMFQPSTLHMGGDEVHFGCWNSSDSIIEWLKNEGKGRNEEDFMYIWNHFQTESLKRVVKASSEVGIPTPRVTLWSSHLTLPQYIHYLDPDTYTVQIWADSSDCEEPTIKTVAEAGLKMVFSNVDGAYLDCGFAGWVTDGNNWCSPYKGWQEIYENDPHKIIERHNVKNEEVAKSNILGGEVAMWTEQTDGMSLMAKVEPRAAAYAERLWRGPSAGGWRQAETRMVRHRERLRERGVGADALVQRWCNQNEGKCLLPPPENEETTTTCSDTINSAGKHGMSGVIFVTFYLCLVLFKI